MITREEIRIAIEEGNYEKAAGLLKEYVSDPAKYSDTIAIYDAAIGEYYGDRQRMWEAIRSGLLANGRNYELYVMLGNYYLQENMQKSWLCYENALFYCDEPEDQKLIRGLMDQLENEYDIVVNRASAVILSDNLLEYTKLCIDSIRMTTPEGAREIIVVDNASEDGSVEWLRLQPDIILLENREKIKFSAGCNQGITAASGPSDIFLLHNDTILTENTLFWLRMGLYDKEENGAVSCVSNCAVYGMEAGSNICTIPGLLDFGRQTNLPEKQFYENRIFLDSIALLIRREALNRAGLMDERFSSSPHMGMDYGLRLLKSGYKNLICKNSFIICFGKRLPGGNSKENEAFLKRGKEEFKAKWGDEFSYYSHIRKDLLYLIEEEKEKPLHILEIGCGCGASLEYAGGGYLNAKLYGVELNPKAAQIAAYVGEVICADVENLDFPWEEEYFDYVLMGDVLEHLLDPEAVLKRLRKHVKTGGRIIISMPNVKHYSVLLPLLLEDRFSYEDAGILDRTHVRMYTGTEIQMLVSRSGYQFETLQYVQLAEELPETERRIIDGLAELMETPAKASYLAYQYIGKAVKTPETENV